MMNCYYYTGLVFFRQFSSLYYGNRRRVGIINDKKQLTIIYVWRSSTLI